MDDWTSLDDEALPRALDRYEECLTSRGLSPITVGSDITYCRRFLHWRTGDYAPRACPSLVGRPIPAGKRDLTELRRELEQYGAFLPCGVKISAIATYVGPPRRFLDWLGGIPAANQGRAIARPKVGPRPAIVPARPSVTLVHEFARIRDSHHEAIVRTVARAALPSSVSRVFATGTAAALTEMLPGLPLDELPKLSDQVEYREWFEAALEPVAAAILRLNPPEGRKGIHPGFKWGHGTKVLSLFVRDVVLFSRYFSEQDSAQIEPWLYCPIDGIVMDRLRRVGFDPKVTLIRQIDEAAFWRIQDALTVAARDAGVPRVWFDDVWSEARD